MRFFITRVLIFCIIGIGAIVNMSIVNYWLLKKALSHKDIFSLDNPEIFIVGDSHTQTALNPDLIENSVNTSLSSEHYFYTYYKLRDITKKWNVTHIILGFTYHNLGERNDKYLFADFPENRADMMYDRYFLVVDWEGILRIKSLSKDFILNTLKYKCGISFNLDFVFLMKSLFNTITYKDYKFFGGFYPSKKSHLVRELLKTTIEKHYYKDDNKTQNFSEIQIYYLKKIVALCERKHIKIILINTPLHQDYKAKVPKKFIIKHDQLLATVLDRYSNVMSLDYSDMHLPSDFYGDWDHVNYKGAEILSKKISTILTRRQTPGIHANLL